MNPGDRLAHFEILEPLGSGGMGEVYRARDTRLGRDVAIKVLPNHLSSNADLRARFEREARTISSLNHPHICTLFDVGREGETDYLVMELVEGETLAQRLTSGPLPLTETQRIGIQIAGALHFAHRAGVIHRDLKPGNVMLTRSGAKLLDFGLARTTGLASTGTDATVAALALSPTVTQPLTAEGTLVGTFQYMAPEQLEGQEADARSDIWALGCVLYEMATGQRPFEGKSQASLIAAIMGQLVPPLSAVASPMTPALERLVLGCLAKDREDRVQTAHDVKLQLEWMEAGSGVTSGATVAAAVGGVKHPRRTVPLWMIPLVALAVTAFTLVGARLAGHGDTQTVSQVERIFHRKTFTTQSIFTARFMPDGQTLVMSAALQGNRTHLFVIRPDYPAPQQVGTSEIHLLSISSRGELAVLNRPQYTGAHRLFDGTLARMPLEGAAPREILEGVREADWSPDGTELAVIHSVDNKDRLEYPIGTILYESAGYLSDVRVSPRGDLIAFMKHPIKYDDRGGVWVVDLAGKARVLADGYWGLEGLAWAPDGNSVYFSGTINGSDMAVYQVDLGGDLQLGTQGAGLLTLHDIAPDGTWVVARDDYPIALMFHEAGSDRETDLSWIGSGLGPVLSGDGKMLLFTDQSESAGPNYAVTLRPTSGGNIVRLGEGSAQGFSRDGKTVLATVPSTPPRIMAYPVGAGSPVRLDPGGLENISGAQWTSGEDQLLVSGNEAGHPPRCFLLDIASGRMDPVGPVGITDGLLAPSGQTFVAKSETGWAIWPLKGTSESRPISAMTPKDYLIQWSNDGTSLYCFDGNQIPTTVDRLDLTTGRRETVGTVGGENRAGVVSILSVAMADDWQTMAYASWYYTSVLYTIEGARQ